MNHSSFDLTAHNIIISGYSRKGPVKDSPVSSIYDLNGDEQLSFYEYTKQEEFVSRRSKLPKIEVIENLDDRSRLELELPRGMVCITGPSNAGKSTIAKKLGDMLNAPVIRFHEPEYPAMISVTAMISLLEDWLYDVSVIDGKNPDVLIVDSFKFFAYNSDTHSAAVSGGISTKLFTELTNLSLICDSLGKTLIVVLNFISEREDNRLSIMNGLIGSVSGYISLTHKSMSVEAGYIEFLYEARTSQSKRKATSYLIRVANDKDIKDGIVKGGDKKSSKPVFSNETLSLDSNTDILSFEKYISRYLSTRDEMSKKIQ
jgi:SpoVK/Ycf46/Vps4 family AAA+-type ATPase